MTVPGTHPISIAGRSYLLDLRTSSYSYSSQFSYETIPMLNPQQLQTTAQVSEANLNPEGLWRRSQDSWHKGAGQTYLDKPESDGARFRSSLGIDPWTKGQISLLSDTSKVYTSVGGIPGENIQIILGGLQFIYMAVDKEVYSINNPLAGTGIVSANIQNGETAQTVKSITSDGWNVYAALGSNGIHNTGLGLSTSSHYSDLNCQLVGYVGGRLMAASGNALYNITASGAAPTALYTHPIVIWIWVGFAEAQGFIYAAGYAGEKSRIYKTAVKPDGTALEVPSVAAPLPDGEQVSAIFGYLGFILIGTTRGVRFAVPDSSGNLQIGALIDIGATVYAFTGQGSFILFSWSNYDGTHTGLGRCDLRTLIAGSALAFASDIMAVDQGLVRSILVYNDKKMFTVASKGIYAESSNKVSSGTIDSGLISYGIPESKVPEFIDLRYLSLAGSDAVYVANESGTFTLVGTNTPGSLTKKLPITGIEGDLLEIRHVFTRDGTTPTTGPILTRHTLKSQVTANMGAYWYLPVMLSDVEVTQAGDEQYRDVLDEFTFLSNLAFAKSTVTLVIVDTSYLVTVEDIKFMPTKQSSPQSHFEGTMIVKLKVVV